MAIVTINMRSGRADEQKRRFAASLPDVISRATAEPRGNVFLVIQQSRGIDFVEDDHQLADFAAPATGCRALTFAGNSPCH